jgi:hypothetical protein
MSIVCLLTLSKAGSQTVTNNDTVKIHIDVAKKVIKDLLLLDGIKQHNDTLTSILMLKNDIIANKDLQIENYKKISLNQDMKEAIYDSELSRKNLELKKTNKKLAIQQKVKWVYLIFGILATSFVLK